MTLNFCKYPSLSPPPLSHLALTASSHLRRLAEGPFISLVFLQDLVEHTEPLLLNEEWNLKTYFPVVAKRDGISWWEGREFISALQSSTVEG